MKNEIFRLTLVIAVLTGCSTKAPDAQTQERKVDQPERAAASQPGAAVSEKGGTPETREQADPDGIVRRGDAVTSENVMTLGQVFANPASLHGKTVKVTGKVTTVCARKGCWMELVGDKPEEHVRITAKGYKFFVPRSSVGKVAVVEGELEVSTLSVDEAQHLEEDRVKGTSEAPKKITEPVQEIGVVASGLEIKSAS
jgi:hypothetical protein